MGLFNQTTEEKKERVVKKTPRAPAKLLVKESLLASRFLSRPRVTEKSYTLNTLNQYVFVVTEEGSVCCLSAETGR